MDREMKRRADAAAHQDAAPRKHSMRILLGRALLICAGILVLLWAGLYFYEIRQPEYAMEQYMDQVRAGSWEKIYQEECRYFNDYSSEEAYVQMLKDTYSGADLSNIGFAFSSQPADGKTRYYNVIAQGNVLVPLELHRTSGLQAWRARTSCEGKAYTINLLNQNAQFTLNGKKLKKSADTGSTLAAFGASKINTGVIIEQSYQLPKMIGEPEITLDDSGRYMAVLDRMDSAVFIGLQPSDEQEKNFETVMEDAAAAYTRYITQDLQYYDFAQRLYAGTDFYQTMADFSNQWFYRHQSFDYQNIAISDVMPIGDNAFLGTISFDYIITADTATTYHSTYQMYFAKDDSGTYKLVNLIQL